MGRRSDDPGGLRPAAPPLAESPGRARPKGADRPRRMKPANREIQQRYRDFNAHHIWEELTEAHGIEVSYSWTKNFLHWTECERGFRRKNVYRQRRARRPMRGMLVHGGPPRLIRRHDSSSRRRRRLTCSGNRAHPRLQPRPRPPNFGRPVLVCGASSRGGESYDEAAG